VLAACGGGDADTETTVGDTGSEETTAPDSGGDLVLGEALTGIDDLIAAAQGEGTVNLIALPDTWANYEEILSTFNERYGIDNPVASPDASSADEVTAIKTLAGQPDMPDAVDVGPAFTTVLVEEGLVSPYKVSTWDEIPDGLKDADGNWVASYYGIMAFGVNTTIVDEVPSSWADLLDPKYANSVALNGDPREAGAAFAAVMSASIANGGSFDDIMPGIEYFAQLKEAGNLLVIDVTEAAIASGEVPIALDWTYNFPGLIPALEAAGISLEVAVPTDALYGGYYAQAVVADSPHPEAAKLWLEHITSDAGALGYLRGGAIPARYGSLVERGLVDEGISKNLPTQEQIDAISFPSQSQIDAANAALLENWGPMVADQ
jgi:putative spermidine/putrescine transport system substrate-binding protein